MRDIKFRAWDVEYKRMILPRDKRYHQHFMSFCGNVFLRTTESMSCFGGGDQLHWEMREKILMQYTGLTDKNGKEIYEGDIVCASFGIPLTSIKSQVEFENGCFIVKTPKHNPKQCTLYEFIGYMHEVEIIGNIYENKELLND